MRGHLADDVAPVLDVVLDHLVEHHVAVADGHGAHRQPVVVQLGDGVEPRERQRQVEQLATEDGRASR